MTIFAGSFSTEKISGFVRSTACLKLQIVFSPNRQVSGKIVKKPAIKTKNRHFDEVCFSELQRNLNYLLRSVSKYELQYFSNCEFTFFRHIARYFTVYQSLKKDVAIKYQFSGWKIMYF